MDVLRQWALCLIIAGAAGTFAMALSPKGSMDKTLRAVIGIFIVAVICAPLASLENVDDILPAFAETDYADAFNETEKLNEYILSAYEETVKKEIETVAEEYGISPDKAEVDMYIDDDYCIIIQKIEVQILSGNSDEFSLALQKRLGAPVIIKLKRNGN